MELITSNRGNTGYQGITLQKRKNAFSLVLTVNKCGNIVTKRVSIGKKNTIEYTMDVFVKYRCDALDIKKPEVINYSKILDSAKMLGYVPKNSHIDNTPIEIPIFNKHTYKDDLEYVYDVNTNTGYRNITIYDGGNGVPTLKVNVKHNGKSLTNNWSLYKHNPKEVLEEAVKLRCDFLNTPHELTVDCTKMLNTISTYKKEPYIIREYPHDKLTRTGRRDTSGNELHEYICPGCGNTKETTLSGWNRAVDNNYVHYCNECNIIRQPINVAAGKKRSNNKSGYIGVNRNDNPARDTYGWASRIMSKGVIVFKVFYNDKDLNIGDDGAILAAIDRDIHIRENNLPHRKNFTDEELDTHIDKYRFGYVIKSIK